MLQAITGKPSARKVNGQSEEGFIYGVNQLSIYSKTKTIVTAFIRIAIGLFIRLSSAD
jgi:hypothetical protein